MSSAIHYFFALSHALSLFCSFLALCVYFKACFPRTGHALVDSAGKPPRAYVARVPRGVNSALAQYEFVPHTTKQAVRTANQFPPLFGMNCFHTLRSNTLHSELRLPAVACMATTSQSHFAKARVLGVYAHPNSEFRIPHSEFRICDSTVPNSAFAKHRSSFKKADSYESAFCYSVSVGAVEL